MGGLFYLGNHSLALSILGDSSWVPCTSVVILAFGLQARDDFLPLHLSASIDFLFL